MKKRKAKPKRVSWKNKCLDAELRAAQGWTQVQHQEEIEKDLRKKLKTARAEVEEVEALLLGEDEWKRMLNLAEITARNAQKEAEKWKNLITPLWKASWRLMDTMRFGNGWESASKEFYRVVERLETEGYERC